MTIVEIVDSHQGKNHTLFVFNILCFVVLYEILLCCVVLCCVVLCCIMSERLFYNFIIFIVIHLSFRILFAHRILCHPSSSYFIST